MGGCSIMASFRKGRDGRRLGENARAGDGYERGGGEWG